MRVWRLCARKHAAKAFDGEGASRSGGRWNHRGTRMVYTASTLSLGVLEVLVHLDRDTFPDDQVVIAVEVPEDLEIVRIDIRDLPRGWRSYPAIEATQQLGTDWINGGKTAVLSVPSAVVPEERNYLLNPAHPDSRRLHIGKPKPFRLDPRLVG